MIMIYVDPHVHLRDYKQAHKETIKHGLEVARDSGVIAVFDMPNSDPPVMTEEIARERLKAAKDAQTEIIIRPHCVDHRQCRWNR